MTEIINDKPVETITAYLSDGRYVEVPKTYAEDWALEASELYVKSGLGDWWVARHDDAGPEDDLPAVEILGSIDDSPRCTHTDAAVAVIVTNASQASSYDSTKPHASTRVCGRRACILDALAWAERITSETGVWLDESGRAHLDAPRADLEPERELPLGPEAARAAMGSEGFATFDVTIDKHDFLRAVAEATEAESVEDFVHDRALAFGVTYNSAADPIAIDGDMVTVRYTTSVAEALDLAGQD